MIAIPRQVHRFGLAVLMGTVSAGALPGLLTICLGIPMLFRMGSLWELPVTLLFAVCPFLISFAMVLAGSLFIGLPVAALLRRLGWEGASPYVFVGGLAGAALPILVVLLLLGGDLEGTPFLSVFGIVGGAVTGNTWWKEHPQG